MVYPKLEQVIAEIESSDNPQAMRFEPGIFRFDIPTLKRIMEANKCSEPTARMIYATSWGRYQVMGMTLYSTLGYAYPIIRFMVQDGEQIGAFFAFTKRYGIFFPTDFLSKTASAREEFARHYNGPGNIPAYSEKILSTIEGMIK